MASIPGKKCRQRRLQGRPIMAPMLERVEAIRDENHLQRFDREAEGNGHQACQNAAHDAEHRQQQCALLAGKAQTKPLRAAACPSETGKT